MARLPYKNREDLPAEYQQLFDSFRLPGGQTMNIARMLAHTPLLWERRSAFSRTLLNETKLDPKLRELALLTVGRLTGAAYEFTHHLRFGRRAGLTAEQLEALPVFERHPAFSEQERAVMRYAAEMTQSVRVAAATFAAVHAFLGDEQLVELTLAVAHYNSTVRFLEALQVDVEVAE